MIRYPLAAPPPEPPGPRRMSLDSVAARSGLHPDLVRRFVALSLVEASYDAAGQLWFTPETTATLARIQRLRTGLCLNYAAIGLVLDLLGRIDRLEDELRHAPSGRS